MKTKRVDLSELDCFEVSGVLDDTYHIDVPEGVTNLETMRKSVANTLIYTKGTAEISFERYPGELDKRCAGMTTVNHKWPRPNPGRVSFRVTTPDFIYYCIKDPNNRPLVADELRLAAGESATIPAGRNVFVAIGSANVNGKKLEAPAQVLTDSEALVSAVEDVIGAVFVRYPQ
jgi:hypothetical protein